MKRHKDERCVVTVFAKNSFPAIFLSKRAKIFEIFGSRFNFPHCPMLFLSLKLFSC